MVKCNAPGCTTDKNTQINGKSLTLFSFPTYDDSLVKQWAENSKVTYAVDQDPAELKLCELHFASDTFASEEKNALAPGAVPTIFESNNKRSLQDEEEVVNPQILPAKQIKLQELPQPPVLTTPPQSPNVEVAPEPVINEPEKPAANMPMTIMENSLNGISGGSSVFTKQIDMGKKVYRLIIRIDKVVEKSGLTKEPKAVAKQPAELNDSKGCDNVVKNGGGLKPCTKSGCKLVKTVLNSKPMFQCERCNKYYIVKENNSDVSNWICYICQEVLPSPDSLSYHVRKHFTCDMCQAQSSSQISHDKHLRLHVSTDPLLPYKCHKCANTFEVKADVRQHYAEKHAKSMSKESGNDRKENSRSQKLFRCEFCYAVFKKEQAYKSHVNLHTGNSTFDCALCTKSFKTAKHLASHQARHLAGVKFTCHVCGKEFSSIEAVDEHAKIHAEVASEEHKCNICKKIFNNDSALGSHMRGHLSRAHRCPSCNKAFINKTTLRIHFKTHSKASSSPANRDLSAKKRHTCTLCPSTFDSRSRLYNHIMTHLEQMHGGEGEDAGFDGLDELLESDVDIVS